MSRKMCLALALTAMLVAPSCYTMKHKVGTGGTTASKTEKQQWWILWGLVPLNEVDSHELSAQATDYTVTTQFKFLDVVISAFTGWVSIYVQTVQVEK